MVIKRLSPGGCIGLLIALSWEADTHLFESPQPPCFLKGSSRLTAEFQMSPMDIQTHICLKSYFPSLLTLKQSIYLLIAALGLGAGSRDYSLVVVHRLLLLRSTGSRVCGLSSCGTKAYLPHGMWTLPRPGITPLSPALAGAFLTTGPPRNSSHDIFEEGKLKESGSSLPFPPDRLRNIFAVFSETLG